MIRSFSLSLLCSTMLVCASACTSLPVQTAEANQETPPAPIETPPVSPALDTPPAPIAEEEAKPVVSASPPDAEAPALNKPPAAEEPKPVLLSAASEDSPPAVTPLMPAAPAADSHVHGAAPKSLPTGGLTLDAAIQKALAASPRLRSANASVLASRGERRQAGLLPNPELGFESENFAGGGPYKGFDSAETTVGVTQLIELGGKRGSRKAVAEQGMALSQFGLEAERLNLIRDVTVAYVEAIAAEERLKIAEEQRSLAEQVFKEVGERVSAAREPLIQQSKAEVTRATSRIAYETAQREVTQTKRKLSSLWGGGEETASLDSASLFSITEPPAAPTLESTIGQNPDLTRWDAELKRSKAAFDLERANAIPDPRLSVGMRDFRDSGDKAFVAGISIPIPVFNRNQGNIERARHNVSKAESDGQAAKLQLGSELSQRYQEMNIAYGQTESLQHSIIPAAEKSFSLSRQGYRAGKFAFLEVLDAQRTLFEAKEQRVAALRNYHAARAEVERLSAKNLQNTVIKNEDDHEE